MPVQYAIGDIHGCNKTFNKLLDRLHISKGDSIYCLGDFVDRGPDSKGVLDTILSMQRAGYNIHLIRGNHETLMLQANTDEQHYKHWLKSGGDATLASFGAGHLAEVPQKYTDLISDTLFYATTNECIYVHAGLNFNLPDPFLDTETMMWDRAFRYDHFKTDGRLLLHGHTPRPLEFILAQEIAGSINLDAGCVFTNHDVLGYLVALDVTNRRFVYERSID